MPKAMKFTEFSALNKPRIDRYIRAAMREQKEIAKAQDNTYGELTGELAKLLGRGGKRLRPLLYILAYEAYGGRKSQAALQLAVSQEFLHAFLLIHDDIIDRDSVRWGGPNITGVYFEKFSKTMTPLEALHAAEAWSLMAGDMCLAMANDLLAGSGFDPALLLRLSRLYQSTVLVVMGGEITDVANSFPTVDISEKEILAMYRAKTASYSFRLPLICGAICAAASEAQLQKLSILADDLGLAFQLHDDVLGMFGDERKTGKPAIGDLREGKRTVLINYALQHATLSDRTELENLLGAEDITSSDLTRARTIITDSGAYDYVQNLADSYIVRAVVGIQNSTMDATGKMRLTTLAQSLTRRSR